jgi:hypothetical protein
MKVLGLTLAQIPTEMKCPGFIIQVYVSCGRQTQGNKPDIKGTIGAAFQPIIFCGENNHAQE